METDEDLDPRYRAVPYRVRLVLDYVRRKCDRAGFWRPEFDVLCLRLSTPEEPFEITHEYAVQHLGAFVFVHPGGAWQLRGWFEQQFPGATPERCNAVAGSAFKILKSFSSILGPMVYEVAGVAVASATSAVALPSGTPGVPRGEGDGGGGGDGAGGVSAKDIQGELALAALQIEFNKAGVPWSPPTGQALALLLGHVEAYGLGRVCNAAAAYCGGFMRKKSVQNWLDYFADWIAKAAPDPGRCEHNLVQSHHPVDLRFPDGKKTFHASCTKCTFRESWEVASNCDHGGGSAWQLFDHAEDVRPEFRHLYKPVEVCPRCGAEREATLRGAA